MRVLIAAIGRLKADAERALVARYVERAEKSGKPLGLSLDLRELTESRAARAADRCREEGEALLAAAGPDAVLVALDEGGKAIDSEAFAGRIAAWRDGGARSLAFLIGGADGLSDEVRARAQLVLAFGAMTWPHQLARIMLAEQLYRATTILSGHPYHRA